MKAVRPLGRRLAASAEGTGIATADFRKLLVSNDLRANSCPSPILQLSGCYRLIPVVEVANRDKTGTNFLAHQYRHLLPSTATPHRRRAQHQDRSQPQYCPRARGDESAPARSVEVRLTSSVNGAN